MRFQAAAPEQKGLSSRTILKLIQALDNSEVNPHSILIARGDTVLAEGYWKPFRAGELHLLNSLSKSVNVLAVGLAVEAGLLSLKDKPTEFFPELLPETYDQRLHDITVRDLLVMAANTVALSINFAGAESSWITHYFTYPMAHDAGTAFFYESGASYMLSAMVTKVTGKTVLEIVEEEIFAPLGITEYEWPSSPEGYTVGGWGLFLSMRDLAKIGLLITRRGDWYGRQIIPAWWIDDCIGHQIDIGEAGDIARTGYGFQFWTGRYNTFIAMGAFGQIVMGDPAKDLFAVVNARCLAGNTDSNCAPLQEFLFRDELPDRLPEDPVGYAELQAYLAGLKVPTPQGERSSPEEGKWFGREWRLPDNQQGVESFCLRRLGDCLELELKTRRGNKTLSAGFGEWKDSRVIFGYQNSSANSLQAMSYAWESPEELLIVHSVVNSCFGLQWRFSFAGEAPAVRISPDATFGDVKEETLQAFPS